LESDRQICQKGAGEKRLKKDRSWPAANGFTVMRQKKRRREKKGKKNNNRRRRKGKRRMSDYDGARGSGKDRAGRPVGGDIKKKRLSPARKEICRES